MKDTLSYAFMRYFQLAIEVGTMFTIATHLIEVVAIDDDSEQVRYVAYERSL